ncbi:hypothetical protein RHDC4_02606 [Rhodocyclaceae bacterium]|nr:hypothetical protein RHDC4_02606 [Rhodocyclaceae bacterium]
MKERESAVLFWLKDRNDKVYHAYRARRRGTGSVCGEGAEIVDAGDMNTAGCRSKLCMNCFRKLYGVPRLAVLEKG